MCHELARLARVGIFERSADLEILWWSDVTWEMFGQEPSTFKLSHEAWLGLIHPEDRERIRQEVGRLTKSAAAVSLRYRIIRPDGAIRHLQSISAIPDASAGGTECIGGIVIDVTERILAEEREESLQRQLRESFLQAGMAQIATGVLHNVGNVLNSLGTANATARRELKHLRVDQLEQATGLLNDNRGELAAFLTDDERGRHLPDYLQALTAHISSNSRAVQAELETTEQLLHHLGNIVGAQQELAGGGGRYEMLRLDELVDAALLMHANEFSQIAVVREYGELPPILTDRHKLLQILVNLISNARDAVEASATDRTIRVKLAHADEHVQVTIEDSGIGMSVDVLAQLWQFGFTTKTHGHGFGLHNSANAAAEIGATLEAHSDGLGHGSSFTLRLPCANPCSVLSGVAA